MTVYETSEFGLEEVFWSMLWFFLFFIWVWLLITVFADIFRSRDLSGGKKVFWTIFIIVLPYLGVFVYLIARGGKMNEHSEQDERRQEAFERDYVQKQAGSDAGRGSAAEISRLADLRDKGVISEEEFQQGKAKALG